MNDEEIEKLLRELPDCELPVEWRSAILSRIAPRRRASAEGPLVLVRLWRLFQRNPFTAGGLAALWLVVLMFKMSTPAKFPADRMLVSTAPAPELLALKEEKVLAELGQDESDPLPLRQP